MIKDAEKIGINFTTPNSDPRITSIGRILRKTNIDELPQLINVLKGEMSLVGPRPEIPEIVSLYTEEQKRVLSVKPGITDYASLEFRKEGEFMKVLETHNFKDKELLQIEFDDGYKVTCTPEHKFFIDGVWIESKDLVVDNEVCCI